MTLTIFGMMIFCGVALNRLNFLVLVPALGLAMLIGATVEILRGGGMGSVLLMIASIAAALQIGYLLATVARGFVASRQKEARDTRAIGGLGFR